MGFAKAGLLSTLSPKNQRETVRQASKPLRLLSTLSPKNKARLNEHGTKSQACCPHYPPKTNINRNNRKVMLLPAVHTIPQKQQILFGFTMWLCRLLSTLSPKNQLRHAGDSRQSPACCPHYPPKTIFVPLQQPDAVMPAVHTIPQKLSGATKSLPSTNKPAVHTIPQKLVGVLGFLCGVLRLLSTLSPKNGGYGKGG